MGNSCSSRPEEEPAREATTLSPKVAELVPAASIVFVTDVEGNWDYFLAWVNITDGVSMSGGGALELADGVTFVFGGDVGDKGNGSLRMFQLLVAAHEKYKERVVLLLGNRDLNKMRFTSELAESEINRLDAVEGPHWVPKAKSVSPKMFLEKLSGSLMGDGEWDALADEERAGQIKMHNTAANRVKWMLEETMGSNGDFERRREELSILAGTPKGEINDDEVTESFVNSVKDGGSIREYIKRGKLVHIHDGIMFVHGGVLGVFTGRLDAPEDHESDPSHRCVVGCVPGQAYVEDVHEWAKALNLWKEEQVAQWAAQPGWTPGREGVTGERGGDGIIEYVVPTTEPSVVMARHLSAKGMPQILEGPDADRIVAAGIKRIVVGHTPHGNCPTVIHQPDKRLTVFMCDTSYSDFGKSEDNRGKAVCNIVLTAEHTIVHGCDQHQREIEYAVPLEPYVGHMPVKDARGFVKGKYKTKDAAGSEYVLCLVAGYTTTYTDVTSDEMVKVFGKDGGGKHDSLRSRRDLNPSHGDYHCEPGSEDLMAKSVTDFFVKADENMDGKLDEAEFTKQFETATLEIKDIILRRTNTTTVEEAFVVLKKDGTCIEKDEMVRAISDPDGAKAKSLSS